MSWLSLVLVFQICFYQVYNGNFFNLRKTLTFSHDFYVTMESAEINKNDPMEISAFVKMENGEDAPVTPCSIYSPHTIPRQVLYLELVNDKLVNSNHLLLTKNLILNTESLLTSNFPLIYGTNLTSISFLKHVVTHVPLFLYLSHCCHSNQRILFCISSIDNERGNYSNGWRT